MKLLFPNSQSRPGTPIVALFGAGLIGTAITTALHKSAVLSEIFADLDWNQPELFCKQLRNIEQRLSSQLTPKRDCEPPRSIRFIWSAGTAGFQSTEEEVALEFARFDDVVSCMERLATIFTDFRWTMIMFSSAGGLFEGQRHVGPRSAPTPSRPYSFLKLRQEQRLNESLGSITKKIYRPTSVYGYLRKHHRQGLISTMLADGIRQTQVRITGFPSTLRDYVWIEDIANFVTCVILDDSRCQSHSVEILCSAKPSSIFELQHIIERILDRPLYAHFSTPNGNVDHITFADDVLPENWTSSAMETNIRKIVADILMRQAVFEG